MIYWDHNSTTPCAPEVVEEMQRYWNEEYGNPSSSHLMGRRAELAVKKAREQVAGLVNALPPEIVFTSGATESNNLLFLGILLSPHAERNQIVVSSIEHKSVLEPAHLLEKHGFEVVELLVDQAGVTNVDAARKLITPETLLVSVQAANNELGTLQPVAELAALAHENGAYFHTDAAQVLGKVPFDVQVVNCDFASFSAHKMYGPKGVGALFVRGGARKWPWVRPFRGGGQEHDLRPGTYNVPGIVGFGKACSISQEYIQQNGSADILQLEKELLERIAKAFPERIVHSLTAPRLPGVFSIAFPKVPADLLIDNLQALAVSEGSACSNRAITISHVLEKIGCERETAKGTIRVSLGRHTNQNDIHEAIEMLNRSMVEIKSILRQP
ncbi:MAG: cysteine desulfurase [Deltaproteobacteria bacterium]|nr:cysteine desulfurase [Deltaproteobacteria bacterium]